MNKKPSSALSKIKKKLTQREKDLLRLEKLRNKKKKPKDTKVFDIMN